jgi:hypothetical protein
MRGLNLARLARSSEASYFSDLQPAQAARLRKSLTPEQIAAAREAAPQAEPTVDTVASIAGHSAYRKLIASDSTRAALPVRHGYEGSLLYRLRDPKDVDAATLHKSNLQLTGTPGYAPDGKVMRALGQNRLNLYQRLRDDATPMRPLPGSEVKAEGAVVGIQAFIVATAIVGTAGFASMLYVHLNPWVIDRLRNGTVRFRHNIESGFIGAGLRGISETFRKDGVMISPQTAEGARRLASKIVKASGPNSTQTDTKPRNDEENA